MKRQSLNNPWFYALLSLFHQTVVFISGKIPQLFPDSASYLEWSPQRTPVYPLILSLVRSLEFAVLLQILCFALATAAFYSICRWVIEEIAPSKGKDVFIWVGSLYFATNFELIQFSPAILTESLGISFFLFYFFSLVRWISSSYKSKLYFVLNFLFFPLLLTMLRPSFILVPLAISFFFIFKLLQENRRALVALCLGGVVVYGAGIQSYAFWNKSRLGHIGISDILQHQILANYMARGTLSEEASQIDASPGLKAFAEAYAITKRDPALKDSQYSLFEQWQKTNPDKDLYTELVAANKELLRKRPLTYFWAGLKNLSVLIDGKASFNYYPEIKNRGIPSKIYFGFQRIADNLFCVLWFFALVYFLSTLRVRPLFGIENLLFLPVATQFLTIAFLGYSELRRQSIGVASLQMLFVLAMWTNFLKKRWQRLP